MSDDGEIVALIKPQFEAGRDKVGKKGVVREKETHREVVTDIVNFLKENDFGIIGSVSYTHLDVYKRQVHYLMLLHRWLIIHYL